MLVIRSRYVGPANVRGARITVNVVACSPTRRYHLSGDGRLHVAQGAEIKVPFPPRGVLPCDGSARDPHASAVRAWAESLGLPTENIRDAESMKGGERWHVID